MILLPRVLDFYNDLPPPSLSSFPFIGHEYAGYNLVKISHKNYYRIIRFDIFGREARIHSREGLPFLSLLDT